MMRVYIIIWVILSMGFRAVAQDKLLVAGSGNPHILLVDKQTGKVEWKHALEKGEECNTVALTRKGEVLYSYKRGAKLVTWDHQVVWDYPAPDKTELQSATLLRDGGVLLGLCGNPARFIELDKNGKEVNEVVLDLEVEKTHNQFRQVFQLRNKNYLIPVMTRQKVLEVTRKGKVVAEHQIEGKAFSSLELKDGNLLLPCGDGHYYMVIDRRTGEELKRMNANDIPGVSLLFVGQILQLKNQNLLICNWYGHTKDVTVDEPQLIEIDKEGKVVWSLHDKENVGKISAACYLKDFRLPDLK
nr:PQQ-binding-like beta-propeller repeat protein [Bacteroides oleiciplenus]